MILFCAREKRQLRRIPVPRHEPFQVVTVPGFLLRTQHVLDFSLRALVAIERNLRADLATGPKQHDREK